MKAKFNCKTCGKTIIEIENDYVSGMVSCGCSCYKIELEPPKTEREAVCDEIMEVIEAGSFGNSIIYRTSYFLDLIKQIRDK